MSQQFVEILFSDAMKPGDLEIVTPATFTQPGQAKLVKAYTGKPRPDAPNSCPLFSSAGGTIGFVANAELIEPPYSFTYWLK